MKDLYEKAEGSYSERLGKALHVHSAVYTESITMYSRPRVSERRISQKVGKGHQSHMVLGKDHQS